MIDFDIDDVQTTAASTPQRERLPDGEYLVVIAEADKDYVTPKKGEPGLNMTYSVQTGPHEGKDITEFLMYKNIEVVKSKVAQIAVAAGLTGKFSSNDVPKLIGKRMIVILKTKGEYQNVVKYVSATGGAAPQTEAAPAAGTPPWARK